MTQFAAYRNPNPLRSDELPLLLDVQTNLLESLATRVVVPLRKLQRFKGISRKQIGPLVADLSEQRNRIIAALDILDTGI